MKNIKIPISKGQYLRDVYPQIETNTILCKTLTGLGATYSEIKADRDSIIVVPNLPVIKGKCSAHKNDNLFGVMEKVDTDKVVNYIIKTKNEKKHIKFITTPESFYKIKHAYQELKLVLEKECFILIDESHKMIKDRDYRQNILLPINDFFRAENKAIVSATPIIPRDPRFGQQNFKIVEIVPDFDYSHEIYLIHTNNMLQAFKQVVTEITVQRTENRSICIFLNSIDIIIQLIRKLAIENESSVFCSDKSVNKLKELKFKQAYSTWDVKYKRQYMFFTSRFYNAVDIELDEKPDVLLISDTYIAPQTIIDTDTDAVQSIGRFRNGVSSVIHIYSTNKTYKLTTKDEVKGYISALERTYNLIVKLMMASKIDYEEQVYSDLLEVHPYRQFLSCGDKDYFAIDNFIDEEMTKSDYGDNERLVMRYRNNRHFNVLQNGSKLFKYGDKDRLALLVNKNFRKKQRIEIVRILDNIYEDSGTEIFDEFIRELRENDELIVDSYFKLGKEVIEQCGYSPSKLKEKLLIKDFNEKKNGVSFINAIKNSFKVGKKYTNNYIKSELKRIYELFDVKNPNGKITAQTIKEYFEVDDKARIKNSKAMCIISSKI